VDILFTGLRVLVSLGAVLGVIWYAHRRIAGRTSSSTAAKPITVISRQGISQKASVVIIEADGRRLVLGVTEHTITVLADGAVERAPAHRADVFARTLADAGATPTVLPASHGLLRGSILSAETWKLSWTALRQGSRT
jgi:flagellar protein FliO/FliZ